MVLMWILFFRVVIADPYDRFRPPLAEAVIPNDRTLHETPPTSDWRTPYADGRSGLPHKRQPLSDSRSGFTHNRLPSVYRVPNVPRGVPRYLQVPYVSSARARLAQTRAPYRFNGQPTSPLLLREFPFAGSPEARRVPKRRGFPMHNSASPDLNRLTAPPNGRMNRFTMPVRPEPTRGAGYRRTRLPTEPTRRGATLSRNNLNTVMASPRRRGQAWYRGQSERQGSPMLRSFALTRPSRRNIVPYETFPTGVSYSYYNTKTSGSPRVGNNAYSQRIRSMIRGNRVTKNSQKKMSLSAFHAQSEVERSAIQTIQDRHESSERNNSSYINISIARDIFADFNNGQHGRNSLEYINTHYPIYRTTSLLKLRIQKEINEQSVKKGKRKDNESDWLKGLWNNLTPNNSTYEDVNGNKVVNSLIYNNNFANQQKGATINSSKVNVENQLIIEHTVFEGNEIGFALNPGASEPFKNKIPTSDDLSRLSMHTKNINVTATNTYASNTISDSPIDTDILQKMGDTTQNVYNSNIPIDNSTNAGISNTKVDTVSKIKFSNTIVDSASNIDNLNAIIDTGRNTENLNTQVDTGGNMDNLNTTVDTGANMDNSNTIRDIRTNKDNLNTLVDSGTKADNSNPILDTATNIDNLNTLMDTANKIDNLNTTVDTGMNVGNSSKLVYTVANIDNLKTSMDTGTNVDDSNPILDTVTNKYNSNTLVENATKINISNKIVNTGINKNNSNRLVDTGTDKDYSNTRVDTETDKDFSNTRVDIGTNINNSNTRKDTGAGINILSTKMDTRTNIDEFNKITVTGAKQDIPYTEVDIATNIENSNTPVDTGTKIEKINKIVGTATNKDTLNTLVDTGTNIDTSNTIVYTESNLYNLNTLVDTATNTDNANTLVDTRMDIDNSNTQVNTGTNVEISHTRDDTVTDLENTHVDTGTNIDNAYTRMDSGTNKANVNTRVDTGTNMDNLNTIVDTRTNIDNLNTILDTGTHINNFNTILDTGTKIDNLNTIVDTGTNIDYLNTMLDRGTNIDHLNTLFDTVTNIDNSNTLVDIGTNIDDSNTIVDSGTNIDNFNTIVVTGTDKVDSNTLVDTGTNIDNLNTIVETGTNIDNFNTIVDTATYMDTAYTRVDTGANLYTLNAIVDTGTDMDNAYTMVDSVTNIENAYTRVDTGTNMDNLNTIVDTTTNINNAYTKADTGMNIGNSNTRVNATKSKHNFIDSSNIFMDSLQTHKNDLSFKTDKYIEQHSGTTSGDTTRDISIDHHAGVTVSGIARLVTIDKHSTVTANGTAREISIDRYSGVTTSDTAREVSTDTYAGVTSSNLAELLIDKDTGVTSSETANESLKGPYYLINSPLKTVSEEIQSVNLLHNISKHAEYQNDIVVRTDIITERAENDENKANLWPYRIFHNIPNKGNEAIQVNTSMDNNSVVHQKRTLDTVNVNYTIDESIVPVQNKNISSVLFTKNVLKQNVSKLIVQNTTDRERNIIRNNDKNNVGTNKSRDQKEKANHRIDHKSSRNTECNEHSDGMHTQFVPQKTIESNAKPSIDHVWTFSNKYRRQLSGQLEFAKLVANKSMHAIYMFNVYHLGKLPSESHFNVKKTTKHQNKNIIITKIPTSGTFFQSRIDTHKRTKRQSNKDPISRDILRKLLFGLLLVSSGSTKSNPPFVLDKSPPKPPSLFPLKQTHAPVINRDMKDALIYKFSENATFSLLKSLLYGPLKHKSHGLQSTFDSEKKLKFSRSDMENVPLNAAAIKESKSFEQTADSNVMRTVESTVKTVFNNTSPVYTVKPSINEREILMRLLNGTLGYRVV